MRNSEELLSASRQEDNDIKSFALLCKALREKRSEKFIQDWLPVFEIKYPIEERPNGSFSISTQDHGVVDYFPKANKVLIRRKNKWIKPGLKWMVKNLAD